MSITRVPGGYEIHRGHRRQRNSSLLTLRPFGAATSGSRSFGAPKPNLDQLVRRRIGLQRRRRSKTESARRYWSSTTSSGEKQRHAGDMSPKPGNRDNAAGQHFLPKQGQVAPACRPAVLRSSAPDPAASASTDDARQGVHSVDWDRHRPPNQRVAMSDKSPRQAMAKKSGKSLKEKRAEKRSKDSSVSQTEELVHKKR